MSLFLPLRRATLLKPSGPARDPNRQHLFVLLTDPIDTGTGAKAVLMVSLSSVQPGLPYDPACRLYPGDHAFVTRDSFVVYQRARIEEAEKLLRGVNEGRLLPQAPMDSAVFARICKGLEDSRLTPPKVLRFYRAATGRNA
jgi:hypothetical protein